VAPQFCGQQDADAFFLTLLQRLHVEIGESIHALFHFHCKTRRRLPDGSVVDRLPEIDTGIRIAIEPFSNLYESLTAYCMHGSECEDGSVMYHPLTDLPPVLWIVERRFVLRPGASECQKITKRFEVPFFLDMAPFLDPPSPDARVYILIGIVVHGGKLRDGHYQACVLGEEPSRWLQFNDALVTRRQTSEVLSNASSPYCLVYVRRELWDARRPFDITTVPARIREDFERLLAAEKAAEDQANRLVFTVLTAGSFCGRLWLLGLTDTIARIQMWKHQGMPELKRLCCDVAGSDKIRLWKCDLRGIPSSHHRFEGSIEVFSSETKLFLEALEGSSESAAPFSLIFFKFYHRGSISYLGHRSVPGETKIGDLFNFVSSASGVSGDFLVFREELGSDRQCCQAVDASSSLLDFNKLSSVHVLTFQPSAVDVLDDPDLIPPQRPNTFANFFDCQFNRVELSLRVYREPDVELAKLRVVRSIAMDDLRRAVAATLHLDYDPAVAALLLYQGESLLMDGLRSATQVIARLIAGYSQAATSELPAVQVSIFRDIFTNSCGTVPVWFTTGETIADLRARLVRDGLLDPAAICCWHKVLSGSHIADRCSPETRLDLGMELRVDVIPDDLVGDDVRFCQVNQMAVRMNGESMHMGMTFFHPIKAGERWSAVRERIVKYTELKEADFEITFGYIPANKQFVKLMDDDLPFDIVGVKDRIEIQTRRVGRAKADIIRRN
jgi:hypothetical protein